MTGRAVPPAAAALAQFAALRAAFPAYVVSVIVNRGDKPRFEVVSRDGSRDPCCLISRYSRNLA